MSVREILTGCRFSRQFSRSSRLSFLYEQRLCRKRTRHLKSLARLTGHASSSLAPGTKSMSYNHITKRKPMQCARGFDRRMPC